MLILPPAASLLCSSVSLVFIPVPGMCFALRDRLSIIFIVYLILDTRDQSRFPEHTSQKFIASECIFGFGIQSALGAMGRNVVSAITVVPTVPVEPTTAVSANVTRA